MPTPYTGYYRSRSPTGYYNTDYTDINLHADNFLVGLFLTISVVVVVLICCCNRSSSRSSRQASGTTATATASTSSIQSPNNVRLNSKAVACLPIFVYNSSSHGGNKECVICLMELKKGDKCRFLPTCGHSFHVECVDMWLHSHSTCPLCRASVEPQPSELPV